MNRRDILASAGAAGLFAATRGLAAGEKKAAHGAGDLTHALMHCQEIGMKCLQHCVEILSSGDKSMAECTKTVRDMVTMCKATLELAAQKSAHLPKLAALCATVCDECAKACEPHKDHHSICKQCMESCRDCAKECRKVAA